MTFTLDTPLGAMVNHPQAKSIIEKHLPGLFAHPMADMFQGMTINTLLNNPVASQIGLTKEKAEELLAEANKFN